MLQELLVRWEPVQGLSRKYYVDEISENLDFLTMILSVEDDSALRLQISFDDSVIFYRSTSETFLLCPETPVVDEQGEYYSQWTFFKMENSALIQWLKEESENVIINKSLIHFVFAAADSYEEIVATLEPRFEWIEYVV